MPAPLLRKKPAGFPALLFFFGAFLCFRFRCGGFFRCFGSRTRFGSAARLGGVNARLQRLQLL